MKISCTFAGWRCRPCHIWSYVLALQVVLRWVKMSKRDFLFLMGIKVEPVKLNLFLLCSPSSQLFLTSPNVCVEKFWRQTYIGFYSVLSNQVRKRPDHSFYSHLNLFDTEKRHSRRDLEIETHAQNDFALNFNFHFIEYLFYWWNQWPILCLIEIEIFISENISLSLHCRQKYMKNVANAAHGRTELMLNYLFCSPFMIVGSFVVHSDLVMSVLLLLGTLIKCRHKNNSHSQRQ